MAHTHQETAARILFGLGLVASPALAEDTLSANLDFEYALQEEATSEPEGDGLPLEANTSFWDAWDGSIELGLNGSTGNTEELDFVGRMSASRETDKYVTAADANFMYGTAEGETTDNEFFVGLRNDWKLNNPKWRFYVEGTYEYDDFQDWQHRVTIGPGVAYQAIKNEKTEWILRSGVQLRREFGGESNEWELEAVLGSDLTHQLTERQELGWTFDLYPVLTDLPNYRFITDAYWKIDVDPETNLFLRIGIHDEYDSSPGDGIKRNDLDYYATLGWSF